MFLARRNLDQTCFRKKTRIKKISIEKQSWDFAKADFLSLYAHLQLVSWEPVLRAKDTDASLTNFYQILNNSLSLFVPRKKHTFQNSDKRYVSIYPEWMTAATKDLIKMKNKLHRKYKIHPCDINYNLFAEARESAKLSAKHDYNSHTTSIENDLIRDPKRFFAFFSYKDNTQTFPDEMFWGQKKFKGIENIANGFSDYFASVFDVPQLELSSDPFNGPESPFPLFDVSEIDEEEIFTAIKSLKNTKSTGNDNIPTYLIKGCADQFLKPLKHIFNLSLNSCTFPKLWKVGKIVPIFKNQGNRNDITNYRPITIINVFSKAMESIIHKRVYFHVKNRISVFQHGCMSQRNITTNLLSFSSYVNQICDQGGQVDVFYSDFAKAFDRINLKILIHKLMAIGCNLSLAKWFYSFLTNRSLFVTLQGNASANFSNRTGIPQGSILGGLLFDIFVDNAGDIIRFSLFQFYVDDAKFYRSISTINDCFLLQEDIDALFSWSLANMLPLNFSKCKVVSYTKKFQPVTYAYKILNTTVTRQTEMKDLGVFFDSSLNFKLHIQQIVKKAYKLSGFILRKSSQLKKMVTYFSLFNALIRPILEYASLIWSPGQQLWIDYIERVQTRFFRTVFFRMASTIDLHNHDFAYYYFSSVNLRHLLKITDLKLRRNVQCFVFFLKLLCGLFDCPHLLEKLNFSCKNRVLRHAVLFHIPNVRSSQAKNQAIYKFSALCNDMNGEIDLFGSSVKSFQKICYDKLGDV